MSKHTILIQMCMLAIQINKLKQFQNNIPELYILIMMITNSIIRAFQSQKCFLFKIITQSYVARKSAKKDQPKESGIIIKNDNLKFQTPDYFVHVFPFHPEIIKKNISTYEINKHSNVLAFTFVKKQGQNSQRMLQKNNYQSQSAWGERKSIGLKFNQISKIITIQQNSGKQCLVQKKKYIAQGSKQNRSSKNLMLKDLTNQSMIKLTLNQTQKTSNGQQNKLWQITTKMPYDQFQIMSYLIKESLFDLSGLRLMFDLKRNEQLAKFTKKEEGAKQVEDLMKEYEIKQEDDRVV